MSRLRIVGFAILTAILAQGATVRAETGYDLWLRYPAIKNPVQRDAYRRTATAIVMPPGSATNEIIAAELTRGLSGLLGLAVPRVERSRSAVRRQAEDAAAWRDKCVAYFAAARAAK